MNTSLILPILTNSQIESIYFYLDRDTDIDTLLRYTLGLCNRDKVFYNIVKEILIWTFENRPELKNNTIANIFKNFNHFSNLLLFIYRSSLPEKKILEDGIRECFKDKVRIFDEVFQSGFKILSLLNIASIIDPRIESISLKNEFSSLDDPGLDIFIDNFFNPKNILIYDYNLKAYPESIYINNVGWFQIYIDTNSIKILDIVDSAKKDMLFDYFKKFSGRMSKVISFSNYHAILFNEQSPDFLKEKDNINVKIESIIC